MHKKGDMEDHNLETKHLNQQMDVHGQGLFVKPNRRGPSALAGEDGGQGDLRYHRSLEEEGDTESLDSEEEEDRDIQPPHNTFLQQKESHRPGKGSIGYKEEIFEENKLPKSLSDIESS